MGEAEVLALLLCYSEIIYQFRQFLLSQGQDSICSFGIATQDPKLRKLIDIAKSAKQLNNYLTASTELMKVMARACGYSNLDQFRKSDLTTWKRKMADLSGVKYNGVGKSQVPVI